MKKIITILIPVIILSIVYINIDYLTNKFTSLITLTDPVIHKEKNYYKKDYSLSYAKNIDTMVPYSKQDIIDILYTSINNRYSKITFYCPSVYKDCLKDVEDISNNPNELTHINNFVHPFNTYKNIKTTLSDAGEINYEITYLYNDLESNKIINEVNKLIKELKLRDIKEKEIQIKTIHDYIINNTKYDVSYKQGEDNKYNSVTAYGPLFEGYAICNGYTDLMAIFLNELDIKNIKVATTPDELKNSNTGHIWNVVYLDNEWKHVDLTWDDPVSNSGKDYLYHSYFLINSSALYTKDNEGENKYDEHNFNKSIYFEIK